jgi:23S rRNA (cytosine1962-C5)-methyltransferase
LIKVFLNKQRKKRLEQGHPWVFANEVERVEEQRQEATVRGGSDKSEMNSAAPALAHVYTHSGRFLASGFYNPQSQIVVRVLREQPLEQIDQAFFAERFLSAQSLRRRFVGEARSYRLVYGEADLLPGLVVDQYEDYLVLQILSLGMDACRELIVAALIEVFAPKGILERSDAGVRRLEGLTETTGVLYGEVPRHVEIVENGLKVLVDLYEGQKTGYFFDQRENRAAIAPLMTGWGERSGVVTREVTAADGSIRHVPYNANGKEVTFPYWDGATVLECFAHTGSFTLHACQYGAKKVTCLDISEHAIATARQNVALNGFDERVEFVVANAFDYLREQVQAHEERKLRAEAKVDTSVPLKSKARKWDVVILDPPAFAKHRGALENAAKGYKEIHLQALKLVQEGGFLVTASCSFHVRPQHFLDIIADAAVDAGKRLRLLHFSGAGKDHPHILGVEEGNYLKFAIFQVTDRK